MPGISQCAAARQTTPAPPREKRKTRKEEEEEVEVKEEKEEEEAVNPKSPPTPPLHTPPHIICMCRIRNDIHREAVRRENWGIKKMRGRKNVSREKKVCSLTTRTSGMGSAVSPPVFRRSQRNDE